MFKAQSVYPAFAWASPTPMASSSRQAAECLLTCQHQIYMHQTPKFRGTMFVAEEVQPLLSVVKMHGHSWFQVSVLQRTVRPGLHMSTRVLGVAHGSIAFLYCVQTRRRCLAPLTCSGTESSQTVSSWLASRTAHSACTPTWLHCMLARTLCTTLAGHLCSALLRSWHRPCFNEQAN